MRAWHLPLSSASAPWQPDRSAMARVDSLIQTYRRSVVATLKPLVACHYPDLLTNRDNEYRKMVELATKMTLVGHAITASIGERFDSRRRTTASLFGGCCFLADSFIDDFGEAAARRYLRRFEVLLTRGWFQVQTDRERLFYVILSRLFARRDVLDPALRQAILLLFEAQKRDVAVRLQKAEFQALPRQKQLDLLRRCARDRSGHAINLLGAFLVPDLPLGCLTLIFSAGALIMHIDDHGDCYADRRDGRLTFMNQVRDPTGALRRIFFRCAERLRALPDAAGRDLLIAFLFRYYVTRLEKHRQQRRQGSSAWAVYA